MKNSSLWQRALDDEIKGLVADAVRLRFVLRAEAEGGRLAREYRDSGMSEEQITDAIIRAAEVANVERQRVETVARAGAVHNEPISLVSTLISLVSTASTAISKPPSRNAA